MQQPTVVGSAALVCSVSVLVAARSARFVIVGVDVAATPPSQSTNLHLCRAKKSIYGFKLAALCKYTNMNSPLQGGSFSRGRISAGTPTPLKRHHRGYAHVETAPMCKQPYEAATPFRQAHIISLSEHAPDGYVCVGTVENPSTQHASVYIYEGPARTQPPLMQPQPSHIFSPTLQPEGPEMPPTFNPRTAANMPTMEKVSKWIQKMPLVELEANGATRLTFFAGTIPSSSESGADLIDNSELEDVIEFQARRVTRFVTQLYLNEAETVVHHDASDFDFNMNAYDAEDTMHLETSVDNYLDKEKFIH